MVSSASVEVRWTEFRGRGFWSRDGLLQVWLAVLVDELDRRAVNGWQKHMRDDWLFTAGVSFNGLVSTQLDDHINSDDKRMITIALCRDVRTKLDSELDVAGAHTARIGGSRLAREDTPRGLLRVADSFLWLLEQPC